MGWARAARPVAGAASLLALSACLGSAAERAASPAGQEPATVAAAAPAPTARAAVSTARTDQTATGPAGASTTAASAARAERDAAPAPPRDRRLPLPRPSLALDGGRSTVRIDLPAESYVTIGLVGPANGLRSWDLLPRAEAPNPLTHESLDEDGRLPTFLSFVTGPGPSHVVAAVDVRAPVTLWRVSADPNDLEAPTPRALRLGAAEPRPIIGLPAPLEPRAGYLTKPPPRYLFFRIDVAVALRKALRQTRIRFRRNPIVVGDGSQWDGLGPGTDLDSNRHIGHRGGSEVDIGLPSDDDSPSTIERRCTGVLIEKDELVCSPGTVRHVDAQRLAYFLGLLLDGPTPNGIHMPKGRPGPVAPVLSILTDQAYVDAIRKAAERLRERRWIHDEGFGALVEQGLLRPSSWHTDHVHIRFAGEPGRPLVRAESR